MKTPLAIVITGPTASGKSALAINLARVLQTEIISADSRQIYKGIPIVTAVPPIEEREGIQHHLLEILDLKDYYSAASFQQDASSILKNLFFSHDTVVVCGGSMLYLDALINGIDELPTVPSDVRNRLMSDWQTNGNEWLIEYLKKLDYEYFKKIDHRNLKRVFHAVEISITAGVPYSSLLIGKMVPKDFNILKICLTGNRDYLFNRINQRVITMMESGLEEEARKVYHLRHLNSLNTVGLKEMFNWFDGKMTREEAIARIQKNTRVYAKKQETWHKKDKKAVRLDFASPQSININKIIGFISSFRND